MARRPQRPTRRWAALPAASRRAIVVLSVVQLTLAGAAWADLLRRTKQAVRGPKWAWALVIAVNFVGPLLYFHRGRVRPP